MSNFNQVKNLRKIIKKSKKIIKKSNNKYKLNFSLKVLLNIKKFKNETFLDEASLAKDFQNPKKPDYLYINHGEYIKEEGILHLISALKEKKNTNRALISLINQKDIINSGDKPIPSFMSLQVSIEKHKNLYITVYFRALEVSKFLKINLEEIRLIINEIYKEFNEIETVKLHIFSFRAYSDPYINPLIRPEIETLDQATLLKILEKRIKEKLLPLLEEKIETKTTVVDDQSFSKLLNILNDSNKNEDIDPRIKSIHTKKIIEKIIKSSQKLQILREKDSHSTNINSFYSKYKNNIRAFIDEIRKID